MYDQNFINAQRLTKKLMARTDSLAVQQVPACVRKKLKPKVNIGCMVDHTQPIIITAAIHTFSEEKEYELALSF